MKIILFILLVIALFFLIPEHWIANLFMSHITVSGDGENAMDSYDFTVLLIKLVVSIVIASLILWARRFFRH